MMNQLYPVLLTAALSLTLAGCDLLPHSQQPAASMPTPVQPSATKDLSSTKPASSQVPAITGENKEIVLYFLNSLKNKDAAAVSDLLGLTGSTYSFLSELELNSYDVKLLPQPVDQRYLDSEQYEVTLSVDQSNDPVFPTGTSKWLLVSPGRASQIGLFIPLEQALTEAAPSDTDLPLAFADYGELYKTCRTFSWVTDCFDSENEPISQIPLDNGMFHKLMHAAPQNSQGQLTADGFKAYIQDTYGLTVDTNAFDDYMSYLRQSGLLLDAPTGEVIDAASCSHGTSWYTTTLDNVELINEDQVVLSLTYYGDCCCFYPAKKVSYTFTKTADTIWQLCSVKTTEDTGYAPQAMGV